MKEKNKRFFEMHTQNFLNKIYERARQSKIEIEREWKSKRGKTKTLKNDEEEEKLRKNPWFTINKIDPSNISFFFWQKRYTKHKWTSDVKGSAVSPLLLGLLLLLLFSHLFWSEKTTLDFRFTLSHSIFYRPRVKIHDLFFFSSLHFLIFCVCVCQSLSFNWICSRIHKASNLLLLTQ